MGVSSIFHLDKGSLWSHLRGNEFIAHVLSSLCFMQRRIIFIFYLLSEQITNIMIPVNVCSGSELCSQQTNKNGKWNNNAFAALQEGKQKRKSGNQKSARPDNRVSLKLAIASFLEGVSKEGRHSLARELRRPPAMFPRRNRVRAERAWSSLGPRQRLRRLYILEDKRCSIVLSMRLDGWLAGSPICWMWREHNSWCFPQPLAVAPRRRAIWRTINCHTITNLEDQLCLSAAEEGAINGSSVGPIIKLESGIVPTTSEINSLFICLLQQPLLWWNRCGICHSF